MKGGTTQTQPTSQIKQQTDLPNTKKPTAEQIRYAQLLHNEDIKLVQDQIRQVADVTGRSIDEVSVALHDCNYDTEQAINSLLEGGQDQNEWITSSSRKKKHQGSTGQGIDSIISTGKPAKDGLKQSRGGRGGRNRSSEKTWDSDQKDNDENRPPESGRGRGLRDDRSSDRKPPGGRGGLLRRGRGGGKGRSSSRGRGGRIGRNGPTPVQPATNGPAVNGTEMWDSVEADNEIKDNTESWDDSVKPAENWANEDYIHLPPATVKQPVSSVSVSSLFSSSNSWTNNNKEQLTAWGNGDLGSAKTNGISVITSNRDIECADSIPFAPESVDMSIIRSQLAQSPSRSDPLQSNTDLAMMHIHSGVTHNHLGPISKLLDSATLAGLTQQNSVPHTTAQPHRQPKQSKTRKSQKSQIPLQPVEMPDAMVDDLDVQFGNLEFGGDFSGSPMKTNAMDSSVSFGTEEDRVINLNDIATNRPVDSETMSSLSSSLSRSVPVTIASTTSVSSSLTGLEDSSPRHYQHASPHKTQMQPEPIPFPNQSSDDVRQPRVLERPKTPPVLPVTNNNSPLSGVTHSQSMPSASLQSQLVSSLPKETTLDSRVYQVAQHVSTQQALSSKDQLSGSLGHHSTLGSTTMASASQRGDGTSTYPLQPPPGVGIPHCTTQQVSSSVGLSTATVSSSSRPAQHSGKPSLPPGVLPMNTLYGMQQPGMVPAYSMPFSYDEMQRHMQLQSAYYDMTFQNQGRDSLQGTYQTTDQSKFGRSDASSPVQTTMHQANQSQHHLQQQAYLNAATMSPYGYGGLAFYPGSGMMPGGFPTYSAPPMYQQMAPKTHGNVSQYQPAYSSQQHGTHNYTSGYDDLGGGHDFNKSAYHSAITQAQSKTSSVVSTAADLGGSSFKTQLGKYGESKAFLGGTPPPALNLSVQGHSHLGNYPGHTGPFMSMVPQSQQHPHSLFQHHQVPHQHQEMGQAGMSQRVGQSQMSKQSQNKGGHQSSYPGPPYWSSANKS